MGPVKCQRRLSRRNVSRWVEISRRQAAEEFNFFAGGTFAVEVNGSDFEPVLAAHLQTCRLVVVDTREVLAIEDKLEVTITACVHVDVVANHVSIVIWDNVPLDVDRIQATQLVDLDKVQRLSRIVSKDKDSLI